MLHALFPMGCPDTARTLTNLGAVYEGLGDVSQAIAAYSASLTLQPYRPDVAAADAAVARTLNNLGAALIRRRATAEEIAHGLAMLCDGLLTRELLHADADSRDTARSLLSLGNGLEAVNEAEEALCFVQRAVDMQRRVWGSGDSAELAAAINDLGTLSLARGNTDAALTCFTESLRHRQSTLPREHPAIAESLYNLACAHGERGEHRAALTNARECLQIRERVLPAGHSALARARAIVSQLQHAAQSDV